jgi:hypothetical protein
VPPRSCARGRPVGFIASSDNHDGWMGNVWTVPIDGSARRWSSRRSSPRASHAPKSSRLASRHTYADDGPAHRRAPRRDGPTAPTFVQGSEIVAPSATLTGAVHGTAPIARVRLVG